MVLTAFKYKVLIALAIVLPILVAIKMAGNPGRFNGGDTASILGSSHASIPVSVGEMRLILAEEKHKLQESEKQLAGLRANVIVLRRLHEQGEVAQAEVGAAERAYVAGMNRLLELRRAVVEADIAIAEVIYGEEVDRFPDLAHNNGQSGTPKRVSVWSLNEVTNLQRFFSGRFGRSLPITAMGQTTTHDHLGFDHRHAVDVAVHPESAEGKELIQHLRDSGIPFLAFRHAIPGASTGPHIHIGKPSSRLTQR